MAKKFSELPAASAIDGSETLAIVQGGVSKKITAEELTVLSLTMVNWSFPAGAFPTSANVLYIATADHGAFGDADFVASGTWFVANTPTPSGYADFNYK